MQSKLTTECWLVVDCIGVPVNEPIVWNNGTLDDDPYFLKRRVMYYNEAYPENGPHRVVHLVDGSRFAGIAAAVAAVRNLTKAGKHVEGFTVMTRHGKERLFHSFEGDQMRALVKNQEEVQKALRRERI